MQIYTDPPEAEWKNILQRPSFDVSELEEKVRPILEKVKAEGDSAVKEFSRRFDNIDQDELLVREDEVVMAEKELSDELKAAIRIAYDNIYKFHKAQKREEEPVETTAGVSCWRKTVAIEKVGLYIPGGTAPLFSSVLMLAIPARIAGCREVVLATPPGKDGIHPAILYSAHLCGVSKIVKAGGAQAIAAMAYGTESVPQVYKIFGPGNQYVTAAKRIVSRGDTGIDMPAGPSEVAVLADETGNARYIAADLLSQAEHGADSQVVLVTTHEPLLREVQDELERQLKELSRSGLAMSSLENSRMITVPDMDRAMRIINYYAPEHLIIQARNDEELAGMVINAGSVFLGNYTPESAGDYASGTNHTLPTGGFARIYSGVSLDFYVKKITFQKISAQGLRNIGPVVQTMAEAEQLTAHKSAVTERLKDL